MYLDPLFFELKAFSLRCKSSFLSLSIFNLVITTLEGWIGMLTGAPRNDYYSAYFTIELLLGKLFNVDAPSSSVNLGDFSFISLQGAYTTCNFKRCGLPLTTVTSSSFLMGTALTLYLFLNSLERWELMMILLMWEGAVKCAFLCFLLELVTSIG